MRTLLAATLLLPVAVDAGAFDAVGLNAQIGGRGSSFQALKGDIAALIAIKGTSSSSEHASLETYLKVKYGL